MNAPRKWESCHYPAWVLRPYVPHWLRNTYLRWLDRYRARHSDEVPS